MTYHTFNHIKQYHLPKDILQDLLLFIENFNDNIIEFNWNNSGM